MTSLLTRIAWKMRGRRLVRIQLKGDAGAVEGVLLGRVGGHYRLANPIYFSNTPDLQASPMVGDAWIPTGEVLLLNVKKI